MGIGRQEPASLTHAVRSTDREASRHHFWDWLRLAALWGNLLYAVCFVVVIGVIVGLGSAPWRAYANVLFVLVIAGGTPLLNMKAVRGGHQSAALSAVAVVLNLACLAYLVTRPAFSIPVLGLAVALVPLLNVIAVLAARAALRRGSGRYSGYRAACV